ncbi:hypothetical protein PV433_21160 [Paenibacillus sp. GYB004]|uniref:hypothetical protein n=1 Tax=Paenibacillus sp. GYB004 TaxID=2994393 RepID=UPI002F96C84C
MSRKGNTFSFRLRKVDTDLAKAIDSIDASALSDLCRDGLRLILGLTTTKRLEVTERPLVRPDQQNRVVESARSKPVVFIPNQKR